MGADVASLTASVEQLTAELAQLAQDISDLQAQLKEPEQQMAKATEDRAASKEKNANTIQEAKDAQEAVSQALAIIKDFYAKAAESTAFAQQSPSEDQPESWNTPYKGKQAQGGGVIDFL